MVCDVQSRSLNMHGEKGIRLVQVDEGNWGVFDRLVQLYLHEISAHLRVQNTDAATLVWEDRPGFPPISGAWLIYVKDLPAGFAIMEKRHCPVVTDFFIMNNYRQLGLGRGAAEVLLANFPGPWKAASVAGSEVARSFWKKVIGGFVGSNFRITADAVLDLDYFEFTIKPPDKSGGLGS
ncbi:MAG: hypothetical protein MH204_05435 [Fimbriimonadaceae bacterium]|nr:hypothetical protein [Fimbriimonadaceae bacterium]